jgi:hypothetical protein
VAENDRHRPKRAGLVFHQEDERSVQRRVLRAPDRTETRGAGRFASAPPLSLRPPRGSV